MMPISEKWGNCKWICSLNNSGSQNDNMNSTSSSVGDLYLSLYPPTSSVIGHSTRDLMRRHLWLDGVQLEFRREGTLVLGLGPRPSVEHLIQVDSLVYG